MKENIVLNSHINFLINQIATCDRIPNLKRKHAYALGAIRTSFQLGHLSRSDYFDYMKTARSVNKRRQSFLIKPFLDSLKFHKGALTTSEDVSAVTVAENKSIDTTMEGR